jgi:AcrR family transcriptional regulator
MANTDTKELILEAAEKLFAAEGYHGASVRAITREAGVNLASVNYHFGSKEALLEALFEHRFGPINTMRKERLSEVMSEAKTKGRRPGVEDVLRAFLSPVFENKDSCGPIGKLSALIHMAHSGHDTTVMSILVKTFKPVMDLLFKALKSALPGVPESEIRWKMHFFIGGFTHTIRISLMHGKGFKVPTLPGSTNRENLVDMMVKYFSAGMES